MDLYMARQPILNRRKKVVAYELLFRDGLDNKFPKNFSDDMATSRILVNYMFYMGMDRISQGLPVTVNFSETMLKSRLAETIPTNDVIIEILETAQPNQETYDMMRDLFHKGYRMAMDDFVYSEDWERFLKFVKMIKFDIQATPIDEIKSILPRLKEKKIKVLAEKVETHEEFEACKEAGFDFYQGWFFCKPEILKAKGVDYSDSILMQLYVEVMKPSFKYSRIKNLFEMEPALSYNLIRYVNSPTFKPENEIKSIHQAVAYLGEQNLRRFICLLTTAEINPNKPSVLVRTAMARSRFCEQVGKHSILNNMDEELFLTGLFSNLDALLDKEMEEILKDIHIDRNIRKALLKREGKLGRILTLVEAWERGDWPVIESVLEEINMNSKLANKIYQESLVWGIAYEQRFRNTAI